MAGGMGKDQRGMWEKSSVVPERWCDVGRAPSHYGMEGEEAKEEQLRNTRADDTHSEA